MMAKAPCGPEIRDVRESDRDGLLDLWAMTWSATYGSLIGLPAVTAMLDGLREYGLTDMLPTGDEVCAAVAVLEGTVVGSAIMAERGSVAYLWGMYVHPSRQRRGLGTSLLRYVAKRFVAATTIEVRVLESSPWAIAFYQRYGFVERNREQVPLGPGNASVPGLVMTVAGGDLRYRLERHVRLGPDEAIVATFAPGGAGYATFPVTNVWGVSPDYRTHQTSLNNYQAALNPDGSITVVVAGWDPGVFNWVDTAGLEEGIIMLRWQVLAQAAALSGGPGVSAEVVTRATLADALPPTIRHITPAERLAQLAARAEGWARRFEARFP